MSVVTSDIRWYAFSNDPVVKNQWLHVQHLYRGILKLHTEEINKIISTVDEIDYDDMVDAHTFRQTAIRLRDANRHLQQEIDKILTWAQMHIRHIHETGGRRMYLPVQGVTCWKRAVMKFLYIAYL